MHTAIRVKSKALKSGLVPVMLVLLGIANLALMGCAGLVSSKTSANTPPSAPSITTQPTSQSVTVGQTASFSVVAAGAAPLSYQWKKNGTVISGATSANYTTPATTSADNGEQFTVGVSNSSGSVTSSAAILTTNTTPTAPSITTQPTSQSVTVGKTASFSVVAAGTAPLSYQWRKNGVNIAGATSSGYTTPATTTADSGSTFDAVVTNSVGTKTSSAAALTVTTAAVAPTITTQPTSKTVTAGQTASFSVVAAGTAPLSYQWQKNGAAISGATSANYTTPATTSADNGEQFTVAVSNSAGSVNSTAATLTVNNSAPDTTPPSVPTGLNATAMSSSQISLSWTASTDNVGVTGYKVFRGGVQVGTSASTSFLDSGLAASTTFTYAVAAFDAAGNTSAQSAGASATTQAASSGGGIPNTIGWFQIPNTTFATVQQTSFPSAGDPANVMIAWSGATYDSKRNRMIIWGGGHGDYAGNEVYVLDLASNPIAPRRLNNPDQYTVNGSCHESIPGTSNRPGARHTYGGLTYLPTQDRMFALSGSIADCGSFSNSGWLFDPAGLGWNLAINNQASWQSGLAACVYDQNKDLVHCFNNTTASLWDYVPSAGTLTEQSGFKSGFGNGDFSGVMDPNGKRMYLVGGNFMAFFDLSSNAPYPIRTDMAIPASCGTFASGHWPGVAYDPVQKLIVEWHGGNSVNTYNPSTNTCSSATFSGGPPSPPRTQPTGGSYPSGSEQADGTFGRFQYIPSLGVFIVCNDWAINCYSLRMSAGASGPAISGIGATSLTTAGATIGWTTDVPATSQVEYGPTISYGSLTTLDPSLVTAHSTQLTGLSMNTLYHYRVHSKNSSGTESISTDLAFQTNGTSDTTPPTITMTSPANGATLSGTVTLSANASDNVGVTSVQFQLDGANIGSALSSSPYSESWNTATSANGAHVLTAQARDAAGNVGTSIAVSVTVSNTASSADQNFQMRCAQPGVLNCQGFDDPNIFTTITSETNHTDGFNQTLVGTNVSRDTTVFLSGTSSVKFSNPQNANTDNPPGANYWGFFGQGANNQRFGSNSDFYVQFAFRADSTWVTHWVSDSYPKMVIFHSSDSGACAAQEITTINIHALNVINMYSECGNRQLYTGSGGINYDEGGSTGFYGQQGWVVAAPFTGYECEYSNGQWSGPNCFNFQANQWYTLYYHVHIGTLNANGTANPVSDSIIEAWVAPYGQQLRKWMNVHNYPLFNDGPSNCNGQSPCPPFNVLELTQFMTAHSTGGGGTGVNAASSSWYDELIISTKPIPAPGGQTP